VGGGRYFVNNSCCPFANILKISGSWDSPLAAVPIGSEQLELMGAILDFQRFFVDGILVLVFSRCLTATFESLPGFLIFLIT